MSTSAEQLVDHFNNALFKKYGGVRHVRRVAPWLGFVVRAVEDLDEDAGKHNKRQLTFAYRGQRYKARFCHRSSGLPRGGIQFLKVQPGRGSPNGEVVLSIGSLEEAEQAFQGGLRRRLQESVQ